MTITEAGLEALLAGEAPEPSHGACVTCYPLAEELPAEVVAICGYRFQGDSYWGPGGAHRCADCVAAMSGHWPCGHQ